jgi:DtxR family transcriptional regulator, Mn-dependent transcriptional regulator
MHEPDFAEQDVEEVAEELWTLGEEGRAGLEELRRGARVPDVDATLRRMEQRGLASVEGALVRLSDAGRTLAERQVRRHRLAETLFAAVLRVDDDGAINRTACVMEHILDAALTDSVCAFLGHPKACPHGKPIPAGPCCRSFDQAIEPAVLPLDRLPVGQSGRVVFVVARERERLARLSTLGVVPGATVHLEQVRPAAVLRIGETTLAVEPAVAAEIYVKRLPT